MIETFRLDEDRVPLLLGEPDDLVFDRRTVARARRFDLTRIHRRAMQIGADQVVRFGARVRQMAKYLREREPIGDDREWTRRFIAGRLLDPREVDGCLCDARRRSGLQTAEAEAECEER